MAKIDTTLIEGYDKMSAEDKLKALEGYDLPDPDYTGYVKKDLFDKTASELADKKKQLKDRMSEDEIAKQKEKEERDELQNKYNELLRKSSISENKSKLLALGYDDALATETAEAMLDGDLDKVFVNQQKHLKSFEKTIRADLLKGTPRPVPEGGKDAMTLEKLRKMSPAERYQYSIDHPEEYKSLYGG